MDKILGNKKAYCVFILPALIIYISLVIIPIFMTGYYSMLDWNGMGKATIVGFQNFVGLFTNDSGFIRSVLNSFLLAVLSVAFQLPIALILALILARGVKGEKFYRVAYFIPVVISSVVIGQLWAKIYNPDYGMLNEFLKSIGLSFLATDWLGRTETSLTSALIPTVWQFIGYHMLLMYTAIKSVPDDILEAAKIDGASEIQTALKITIPLIAPMIKVSLTFAIIGSLKFFDLIYILTKGGPIHSSEVPGYLMYNTIFNLNQYGQGSAIAVFIVIECIIFYWLIEKFFKTESIVY